MRPPQSGDFRPDVRESGTHRIIDGCSGCTSIFRVWITRSPFPAGSSGLGSKRSDAGP